MNTPYERIARNDDEPYDTEGEWVGERQDSIFREWRADEAKLLEYIIDAMGDDEGDVFPRALATFFLRVTGTSTSETDAEAAGRLWNDLKGEAFSRMREDAYTAAQAEWDALPIGPVP